MRTRSSAQDGFTLAETLVAIVVLSIGLMAVTNLLLIAATNNLTAGLDTSAAQVASEQLDMLRTAPYQDLAVNLGGDLDSDQNPSAAPGQGCPGTVANHSCYQVLTQAGEGGARIRVRWVVRQMNTGMIAITVRAVPLNALGAGRAQVELQTIRTCTAAPPRLTPPGWTPCPDFLP